MSELESNTSKTRSIVSSKFSHIQSKNKKTNTENILYNHDYRSNFLHNFKNNKLIHDYNQNNTKNNISEELYSYPLFSIIRNRKMNPELKLKLRMIINKREKEKTENHIKYYKLNYYKKRTLSSKPLTTKIIKKIIDKREININKTPNSYNGIFSYTAVNLTNSAKNRTIHRSNSSYYPFCKEELYLKRKKYLSQIEKRGNYYNRLMVSSLQRGIFNSINRNSLLNYFDKSSIDSKRNKIIRSFVLETPGRKQLPKLKKYLRDKMTKMQKKREENRYNFEHIIKPEIIDLINYQPKRVIKIRRFRNKNYLKNKTYDNRIEREENKKRRNDKIKDWKIMISINKLKDPDIIQKYKSLLSK